MGKLNKNSSGFSAVETVLVLVIVGLIAFIGYYVWHTKHIADKNLASSATSSKTTKPATTAMPKDTTKYLDIRGWGVKVPYVSDDTLAVSSQTCDNPADNPKSGCFVAVSSKLLANSVGSCASSKATGVVGYFNRSTANEVYSYADGSGYDPIPKYVSKNPGKYSLISGEYYTFAPLGASWGASGADSIRTSTNALGDTVPTGCNNWMAEYNKALPGVENLVSKFQAD